MLGVGNAFATTRPATRPGPLYRINCGGPPLQAIDDGPAWEGDLISAPSRQLVGGLSVVRATFPRGLHKSVPPSTPLDVFGHERYSTSADHPIKYRFSVYQGHYQVRLYLSHSDPQDLKSFDVEINGNIPVKLSNFSPLNEFGSQIGGMTAHDITVSGHVVIELHHGNADNPHINAIEIIAQG